MDDKLTLPLAIEEVIQRFESTQTPFSEFDVSRELGAARKTLKGPTDTEDLGAWSEILAFALTPPAHGDPWNTYFGPMGSGTSKDGQIFYSPDIAGTPKEVVGHWSRRGRTLSHPLLKARYADLAWDMSQVIGQTKRDAEDARVAIDAYLASIPMRAETHDQFQATIRALDLASLISDPARARNARDALMGLHRDAMKAERGQWWFAVDRLLEDKKAGVTDEERSELVADLEALVVRFTDPSKPEKFEPHPAQDAANRLIKHYKRTQRADDVKRLHAIVARAFEHSASLGNAMLAAAFLQTAMDRYRDAGMPDESRRIRILMQTKIGEANSEMVPIGTEIKISFDDMEKFLAAVIADDIGKCFVNIAREFMLRRKALEETVRKTAEQAPLMAHIPQKIMADDFVAAKIGSVEDDPFGRLFQQAKFSFALSGVWLHETFARLLEKHEVHPEHFVGWANRH